MILPISVETLQWKHRYFQWSFEWDCRGWLESYVLYLAWPEWKGVKFYCPVIPPIWVETQGGSQGEYHKITGNVWVEPWVGLQGANKSAHWDGWETETSSPKGNDRSPESNVPRSNLISKDMSLLPRNKLAWRHHFPTITLWNIFQTLKSH